MLTRRTLLDESPEERCDPVAAEQVRGALERILGSRPFRTSRQCSDLLRYVVEHSLQPQEGDLRERILGIEVFGRATNYDTSEDPVVRMRAADVRKRLAQFYTAADDELVRIVLKPGSYRATFRTVAPPIPESPPEIPATAATPSPLPGICHWGRLRSYVRRKSVVVAVATVFVVASAALFLRAQHRPTPQAQFWAPLLRKNQPVLVYLGSNAAYRFSPSYLHRYQQQHGMETERGPEFFPNLQPGQTIQADDLLPMKNTFLTTGDLAASTQVTSLLSTWAKPFLLRSAGDLSISDLRDAPAVFVGGFNNSWTMTTTAPLPFTLQDGVSIVERAHPEHRWTVDPNDRSGSIVDYALLSRVLHTSTGGPALILAGIGSYGTQAAAELVCNPEKLNALLPDLPEAWNGENLQIVLQIQVVDYSPVAIKVAKVESW